MSEIVARETRQKLTELVEILAQGIFENVLPPITPEVKDNGAGTYKAQIPLRDNAGSFAVTYADTEFFSRASYRISVRKSAEPGQERLYRQLAARVPATGAQWEYQDNGQKSYLNFYADLIRPRRGGVQEELEMLADCAGSVWTLAQELTDPATISRRKNQQLGEDLSHLLKSAVNLAAKSETSVNPASDCEPVETDLGFSVEYHAEMEPGKPGLAIVWRNGYFHARAQASRAGYSREACAELASAFLKDQWEVELENAQEGDTFSFYSKSALAEAELANAAPETLARKIAALCARTAEFAKLLAENPDLTVDSLPIPAKFEPFRDFCQRLYARLAAGAIPDLRPYPMSAGMKWVSTYHLKMEISLEEPVFLLVIRFAILNGAIYWELYGPSYGVSPKQLPERWKAFSASGEKEQISPEDGYFSVLKRYRPKGATVDDVLATLSVEEALPSLTDFYAVFLAFVKMLAKEEGAVSAAPPKSPEKAETGEQQNPVPEMADSRQAGVDGEIRRLCGASLTPFKKFVSALLADLKSAPALESLRPDERREPSLAENRLSTVIPLPDAKVRLRVRYSPAEETLAAGWQGEIPEGMAGMCRRAGRHLRGRTDMEFAHAANESSFSIYTEAQIPAASLDQADAAAFAASLKSGFEFASQIARELERLRSS